MTFQNAIQPEDEDKEVAELLEAVAPFFPKIQLKVVSLAINDKSHPDYKSTRKHYIDVLKRFKETFEKMPKTYDTEPDDPEDVNAYVDTLSDEFAKQPDSKESEVNNEIPKGADAIAYLHYFIGGCDWWITEKDCNDEQNQAFGVAQLNSKPELGYISISEIIETEVNHPCGFRMGIELDFHWTPTPLKDIPELKGMFSESKEQK